MAYDDRYRGRERWRGHDDGWNRWHSDRHEDDGRGWSREQAGRWDERRDADDRGFFDRAGDEVRSWFGDEEAERRRERDRVRDEREWGARRERSGGWNRGDQRAWHGGQSDQSGHGQSGYGGTYGAGERATRGPRGAYGDRDDWSGGPGGYRSNRASDWDRGDDRHRGRQGDDYGTRYAAAYGASTSNPDGAAWSGQSRHSDPHYHEWRSRQIESLDRDYDEYRRENASRFEQEFGSWREKRGQQRQWLGRVTEHMEVVGSDGEHVGKVDKVRGDRIVLAKSDPNAGGHHHSIPCSWVESVDDRVSLNKTADQAMRAWRDEERSRALFEREDSGSEGPHALDRAFSGTYSRD